MAAEKEVSTQQERERYDNWLGVKRDGVKSVRSRAPGLAIGIIAGFLIGGFFASALMPFAAVSLLGAVVGGFVGMKVLGDLSFMLERDPEFKESAKKESSVEPANEKSPQQSLQEARIAAVEKMAAENPSPEREPNYHTSQLSRQRTGVMPPSPAAATRNP